MKRTYLGLVAIVLGFVALTGTTLAQNGTQSSWFDISGGFYNPCCDEVIEISGRAHITVKMTENKDGTITQDLKVNLANAGGTGLTSGISYNFMENGSASATFDPNSFAFSQEQSIRVRVVGKGRGGHECSATAIITIHFEVDADGNIIANDFSIEWECANGNLI